MAERLRIGLISDTHGVCHPRVFDLLDGVDRILHAGDVGRPEVLTDLEAIAPVAAVRGNVDRGNTGGLPDDVVETWVGFRILVTHYGCKAEDVESRYGDRLREGDGIDILVFGHTHSPLVHRMGDVLVVNPGAAGPPRFRSTPSLAILDLARAEDGGSADVEIVRFDWNGGALD